MALESSETNRLLAEILSAIQGLDQSLKANENRIHVIENIVKPKAEPEELDLKDLRYALLEQKVTPIYYKMSSHAEILHG